VLIHKRVHVCTFRVVADVDGSMCSSANCALAGVSGDEADEDRISAAGGEDGDCVEACRHGFQEEGG
jgi:hypothetical protein